LGRPTEKYLSFSIFLIIFSVTSDSPKSHVFPASGQITNRCVHTCKILFQVARLSTHQHPLFKTRKPPTRPNDKEVAIRTKKVAQRGGREEEATAKAEAALKHQAKDKSGGDKTQQGEGRQEKKNRAAQVRKR
jgi:hypothetical protein